MPLLEVKNLSVAFPMPKGAIKAVDEVSFTVERGTTVGLVGESGSGKTTVGRALLKLTATTATVGGEVVFDGQELLGLPERRFRPWRRQIQMIFQDPFNSLNPRHRVETIIAEPLEIHCKEMSRADRRARAGELLDQVGLPREAMGRGIRTSSAAGSASGSASRGRWPRGRSSSCATNPSARWT